MTGTVRGRVVDAVASLQIHSIAVGSNPIGLAITHDDSELFVAIGGDDNVSVIDTGTSLVIDTVPVGDGPVAYGLFIGPAPVPVVEVPTLAKSSIFFWDSCSQWQPCGFFGKADLIPRTTFGDAGHGLPRRS